MPRVLLVGRFPCRFAAPRRRRTIGLAAARPAYVPGASRAAEAPASVRGVVQLRAHLAGEIGDAGGAAVLAAPVRPVVPPLADGVVADVAHGAVAGEDRDGCRHV